MPHRRNQCPIWDKIVKRSFRLKAEGKGNSTTQKRFTSFDILYYEFTNMYAGSLWSPRIKRSNTSNSIKKTWLAPEDTVFARVSIAEKPPAQAAA